MVAKLILTAKEYESWTAWRLFDPNLVVCYSLHIRGDEVAAADGGYEVELYIEGGTPCRIEYEGEEAASVWEHIVNSHKGQIEYGWFVNRRGTLERVWNGAREVRSSLASLGFNARRLGEERRWQEEAMG